MDGDEPMVLVALGSNIDPESNLPRAARLLAERVDVLAVSRVYASPPVGAPGTPEFLNAVVRLSSRLGPRSLKFGVLRAVESRLGRRRGSNRNAPRPIDLDLLLFGVRVEHSRDLELPDPDLLLHPHLAVPAVEVAGEAPHPLTGRPLRESARSVVSKLVVRPDVVLL